MTYMKIVMKVFRPKYGIGEIVIIDCPDHDCRRTHKGQIVAIGSLVDPDNDVLGPLMHRHTIHYCVKFRNHKTRTVEEHYIMKVDTVATMKAMRNGW